MLSQLSQFRNHQLPIFLLTDPHEALDHPFRAITYTMYLSTRDDICSQQIHQRMFQSRCQCIIPLHVLQDKQIYNRPQWLHKIIRQIKVIVLIPMMDSLDDLKTISSQQAGNKAPHNGIAVIQTTVAPVFSRTGKLFPKGPFKIIPCRRCFYIMGIPAGHGSGQFYKIVKSLCISPFFQTTPLVQDFSTTICFQICFSWGTDNCSCNWMIAALTEF